MDKNGKYWGFVEQNEAIKEIYEHNVSHSSCLEFLSRHLCQILIRKFYI